MSFWILIAVYFSGGEYQQANPEQFMPSTSYKTESECQAALFNAFSDMAKALPNGVEMRVSKIDKKPFFSNTNLGYEMYCREIFPRK